MTHLTVSKRWMAVVAIGLAFVIAWQPIEIQAQTSSPVPTPAAQLDSPLPTPVPTEAASAAPTIATVETAVPTYTPLPTLTPLPTSTSLPVLPTSVPPSVPGLLGDPANLPIIIGGGAAVLLLILLLIILSRRRSRRHVQSTEPVKPVAPIAPLATLEFTDTEGKVIEFKLDKPALVIGRGSDSDIVLPASLPNIDTVSRQHARLSRDEDGFSIHDLESQNGLMVNGRHTNHNLLEDGDRLAFGSVEATFHNKR